MDGASGATSERILLEPYKYLLQLPGESAEWWESKMCGDMQIKGQ